MGKSVGELTFYFVSNIAAKPVDHFELVSFTE